MSETFKDWFDKNCEGECLHHEEFCWNHQQKKIDELKKEQEQFYLRHEAIVKKAIASQENLQATIDDMKSVVLNNIVCDSTTGLSAGGQFSEHSPTCRKCEFIEKYPEIFNTDKENEDNND